MQMKEVFFTAIPNLHTSFSKSQSATFSITTQVGQTCYATYEKMTFAAAGTFKIISMIWKQIHASYNFLRLYKDYNRGEKSQRLGLDRQEQK